MAAVVSKEEAPTRLYPLSLHDALPISSAAPPDAGWHSRRPGRYTDAFPLTPSDSDAGNQGSRRSRSEEHTSELQSQFHLVCRLLLEKKNIVSLVDISTAVHLLRLSPQL